MSYTEALLLSLVPAYAHTRFYWKKNKTEVIDGLTRQKLKWLICDAKPIAAEKRWWQLSMWLNNEKTQITRKLRRKPFHSPVMIQWIVHLPIEFESEWRLSHDFLPYVIVCPGKHFHRSCWSQLNVPWWSQSPLWIERKKRTTLSFARIRLWMFV